MDRRTHIILLAIFCGNFHSMFYIGRRKTTTVPVKNYNAPWICQLSCPTFSLLLPHSSVALWLKRHCRLLRHTLKSLTPGHEDQKALRTWHNNRRAKHHLGGFRCIIVPHRTWYVSLVEKMSAIFFTTTRTHARTHEQIFVTSHHRIIQSHPSRRFINSTPAVVAS
jgi:hypothetical protein